MKEQELQQHIRAAISKQGKAHVFRNNVGSTGVLCAACKPKVCERCRKRFSVPVKYGLSIGSGDLIGLTMNGGFISIEVKTPTGTVKPEQHLWHDFINKFGGNAYIVRSVEDAISAVEEACNGECNS